MSYLLDTCIISRLRKLPSEPNAMLQFWILSHRETDYFLSSLTVGEVQAGISKLGPNETKKKMILEDWLLGELLPRFNGRILPFDSHTASIWGELKGNAQKQGFNLPVIDSMIGATAIQHNLILVTENIKDFKLTGAHLLNPYDI
jgi:predicted nucleic acid-binding protein